MVEGQQKGEKVVEKEAKEEVQQMPNVAEYLSAFPSAPVKDQIEQWKQQHGEIFCSGFSETEIFIWKPLKRAEFIGLQGELAQKEGATQFDIEEKTVEVSILWASPMGTSSLQGKAGSLSTLHEQIMQNSNFMDPRMASMLVVKL